MRTIFSQRSCVPVRLRCWGSLIAPVFAAALMLPTAALARTAALPTPQETDVKVYGNSADPETNPLPASNLLLVSPNSIGILVGAPQEMRLTDGSGRHLEGASWTVEDASIARIDTTRGVTVYGVAPGKTIVTATLNGQTVQAKVRVLGAIGANQAATQFADTYEPKLNPNLARKVTSVGDAEFHYQRGLEFFDAGDLQSAFDEYSEALRQKPDFVEAQTKLAYTLWKAGSPEGASVAARHALKLNSNNPEAEKILGLALMKMGDFNGSIPHYKEALRMKPDYADAHFDIGIAYGKIGDHASAIKEYEEAIRLDPNKQPAHLNLGREFFLAGDLSGSVAENREAVRLDPRDTNALLNLANSLSRVNDLEESRHYFEEAIAIDPSDFDGPYGLGRVLLKMQDWQGAAKASAIATDLKPADHNAWCNLGIALLNLGDRESAVRALSRALDLAPWDPQAKNYYAQAGGPPRS